jgi:CrcB protein
VAAGGAVGAGLRAVLSWLVPAGTWDWPVLCANLTGSLALGVLLGYLAALGPDVARRRAVRLTVGTGLLGGYTTYSALALPGAWRVLRTGLETGEAAGSAWGDGLMYAFYLVVTLVVGTALAAFGLVWGGQVGRARVRAQGKAPGGPGAAGAGPLGGTGGRAVQ